MANAKRSPRSESPRQVRVTCEGPAHGGEMVARTAGRVIFVAGALPGEDVTVTITDEKKNFLRGMVSDIHVAHPERREHHCDAAAQGSGCCAWDIASVTLQREMKAHIVREQLARIGHLTDLPWDGKVEALPGIPETATTGWRVRQRLAVTAEGEVGNYAANSHSIVTKPCNQVVPELAGDPESWGIAAELRRLVRPGTELFLAADSLGERHIIVRSHATGCTQGSRRSQAASRRARAEYITRRTVLSGSGQATQTVLGQTWQLPVDAFWQAHLGAADTYAELVVQYANLAPGDTAWDLYGGCGVFAHALSVSQPEHGHLTSVDVAREAVAAGKTAFGKDDRDLTMVESSVAHWLRRGAATEHERPATVVLDPPRAGAGTEIVAGVAAAGPARVLHFGCDPAAFSRDLRLWNDNGYTVSELRVWDGFPNTPHMECFAVLTQLL